MISHRTSPPAFSLLAALVFAPALALAPSAPAHAQIKGSLSPSSPSSSPAASQRYGNFTVTWPAAPALVQHQATSTQSYDIYKATAGQIIYIMSFLQFSSPQEQVTAQDFARNQTSSSADAVILSSSYAKLAGYTADQVIYRIGVTTYLAWSVQPTPQVDYVIVVSGIDGEALREGAQKFSASFKAAQ